MIRPEEVKHMAMAAVKDTFGDDKTLAHVRYVSKTALYTAPRFLFVGYVCAIRDLTPNRPVDYLSYPQIAGMICRKDHTTIMHAEKRAKEMFGDTIRKRAMRDFKARQLAVVEVAA